MSKLSPALRFVTLQIVRSAMEEHCVSSSDLREMKAKLAHYERMAKSDPDNWAEDAKQYRRELKKAERERKLWVEALAELKGES